MKAVILAAGKGTRLRPLTFTRPKPLLEILNISILEHNLSQLNGLVKEVVLIVGYLGEEIYQKIGPKFGNLKIKYLWQKRINGTGTAAKTSYPLLEDKFLLLNGDDLYFKEDLKNLLKKFPAMLCQKIANPQNFGVILAKGKRIIKIEEKPKKAISDLVNTGAYFLPKKIFDFKIKKSKRGEYEFTDYLKLFIEKEKLNLVLAKNWLPIVYPWDLFLANQKIFEREKTRIEGKIEEGVKIFGKVIIEKGSLVRSGTYILGPVFIGKNCLIGPNSFLRENTVIGDNCRIGQGVEIKNSIIGSRTKIAHLSYVGDSILGRECNIGGGTIFANLRLDEKEVKVLINDKLINSSRKKLGAILGDRVKIGVHCSLMPGTTIGPEAFVGPHLIVKGNILSGEKYFGK